MLFVAGVIVFVLLMTWAEARGLPPEWIGPIFLFAPVMVYAAIGVASRSAEPEDFYVAGRRVPAFYNGMAAAADSISVAAFLSLAGALYLQGFSGSATQPGGLAYLMGWIGGFCLLGLLIAPRLRALR
ncbi:MAG: cation acetate symporter, partial [Ottowia sp.]|nr:cation acetate symporter [Ottowia sp.]